MMDYHIRKDINGNVFLAQCLDGFSEPKKVVIMNSEGKTILESYKVDGKNRVQREADD